jgi:Acyl-CoA thioesterase C-terminal domain/Acyl-CoA thioesterase N-terminal domain
MTRFDDATEVKRAGDGCYQVELDAGFAIAGALNGGYLMAVLLRAAMDASPHAHPVATSVNFLRVARSGPAHVWVESRKTGRTAATSRVSLVQDGQPIVDATVTMGTLAGDADPVWSGEPPRLPPVDECLTFGSGGFGGSGEADRGFADRVDLRFEPAAMGWLDGRPSGRLEQAAYFRLAEDQTPDAFVLALAVDALPPVVRGIGSYGWCPTVELTWHMRAVPAPGWLAVHGSGRLVSDGWFDGEAEIWDTAGRLVAQGRQLARVGRGRRDVG